MEKITTDEVRPPAGHGQPDLADGVPMNEDAEPLDAGGEA